MIVTGEPSTAAWGERLREIVRSYGYATIMVGAFLTLWWAVEGPYPLAITSNALYVFMIALIVSLEFWIPFKPKWGTIRNSTRADVIYFLLAAPLDALTMFVLVGVLAQTAQYHHYLQVFHFFPTDAHILIQLLLVTLVVDVFKYWYHRWTHEIPLLWRYHSIHHCLERLEMLRASYFFPLDIMLTTGLGTLAMLMCGVRYEIIIFHNVYAGITGLMNHSNADLRAGVLDVILNSPGHHRAHHSVDLPGSNSNYGSFFNFADRIFGTRYLPENQHASFEALGLDDTYRMPTTFLKQLAVPFRWKQVHKA